MSSLAEHILFEQGALSPLGWPYCCLCFKPLHEKDCWKDSEGQRWDVCVPCKLSEQQGETRRNLV
jgi:hypothetical protein